MRVNVVETKIITYTFTKDERDSLIKLGMWGFINSRLMSTERIEVE